VSTSGHCHLGDSIDTIFGPFFPHVLHAEQSHDAETLWPVTCFSVSSERKNMPDADARTQTAQYPDVADDHSAARELQKVLSLSLPSFYRCALRLLGNRADAEDAVQEALLAAYKHLAPIQGTVADVHLADDDCLQLRPDAIAQTATPNPYAVG
jgi:Sigma-70 region 2